MKMEDTKKAKFWFVVIRPPPPPIPGTDGRKIGSKGVFMLGMDLAFSAVGGNFLRPQMNQVFLSLPNGCLVKFGG